MMTIVRTDHHVSHVRRVSKSVQKVIKVEMMYPFFTIEIIATGLMHQYLAVVDAPTIAAGINPCGQLVDRVGVVEYTAQLFLA